MKNRSFERKAIIGLLAINLIVTFVFVVIPKVEAATGCFPDTNGHWAEEFICWMSDSGLTGGYPDGTYKPENNVTRAEMAVFMKNSYDLEASEDDDTLGSLSCSTDQIAKWSGSAWECTADLSGAGSDTLGDLSCTTDQIAKWNGSAWVCAEDVDTDTDTDALSSLSCSWGAIARWNGSAWICDGSLNALQALLVSLSLENDGKDLVFTGVNVHVRDGSGDTDGAVNGSGNLIVGYNEDTVVGGIASRSGSHNLVLGTENEYTSYGGFVVGKFNTISGEFAMVSGGRSATASGSHSSISGGMNNIASGDYSSVSGGLSNIASSDYSSVNGGVGNTASGDYSSVSGGSSNIASGDFSSVLGGGGSSYQGNEARANYSVVVGGRSNVAGYDFGTDRTVGEASAVLAGFENLTTEDFSSVSGGASNTASGPFSSVSGGHFNIASGDYSCVLGGGGDTVSVGNEAWAHYSVIAGGKSNTAGDDGGTDRTVGEGSAVLAGSYNLASGDHSSVTGGTANIASGNHSSISGGLGNTASGAASSVSGGEFNTASGSYSSISGGNSRSVSGAYDWKAGTLFEDS